MKHSPRCTALVKSFESLCLKAVPDPKTHGAPWTWLYGHTGPEVHPGMIGTEALADKVLESDLSIADAGVAHLIGNALTTQNQWDALCSLVFNVGAHKLAFANEARHPPTATLILDHIAGRYADASAEFLKWDDPGSNVQEGLLRRRKAEAALYRSIT